MILKKCYNISYVPFISKYLLLVDDRWYIYTDIIGYQELDRITIIKYNDYESSSSDSDILDTEIDIPFLFKSSIKQTIIFSNNCELVVYPGKNIISNVYYGLIPIYEIYPEKIIFKIEQILNSERGYYSSLVRVDSPDLF